MEAASDRFTVPRAVLLKCPVCDALRALEGKRADRPRSDLYATAADHVRDHPVDETETAIQKHRVVARAVELVVSPDELDRLPTERWRDRGGSGIPRDHSTDATTPTVTGDPTTEAAAPRSHVED